MGIIGIHVCVNRCAEERLMDMNVLRGATGGMSDHFLLEASVKLCAGFRKTGNNISMKEV